MRRTMFEIIQDFMPLYKEIEDLEEDEGYGESLNERLNINENEMVDKMEGYFYLADKFKNEADFWEQHEKRAAAKKKAFKGKAERLLDEVDKAMTLYGKINPKSKATGFKSKVMELATVKATAVSYPIIDSSTMPPEDKLEKEIPTEYLVYPVTMVLSKKEVELFQEITKDTSLYIGEPKPTIKTDDIKRDLKEGVVIGNLKLEPNYKTKFS